MYISIHHNLFVSGNAINIIYFLFTGFSVVSEGKKKLNKITFKNYVYLSIHHNLFVSGNTINIIYFLFTDFSVVSEGKQNLL